MERLFLGSPLERGCRAHARRLRWERLEDGTSSWLEQTDLHGEPGGTVRLRWSNRRGDAFRMFFCGRRGNCPVFCLKLLEYLHLPGTHSLSGSQLIASEIIALSNLLLDGAFNIAECELRVAPARQRERVTQEAQPVGIGCEPRFIESCGVWPLPSLLSATHSFAGAEARSRKWEGFLRHG